jgi:hypothetical protein
MSSPPGIQIRKSVQQNRPNPAEPSLTPNSRPQHR